MSTPMKERHINSNNKPVLMLELVVGAVGAVECQITEMAGDVVECCALAKRVALRLTEVLADGACPGQRSRESVSSMSVGEDTTNRQFRMMTFSTERFECQRNTRL